jgi:hypothetical protein
MLQELVRPFNGLQEYKLLDNERGLVHFSKHEDAKIALAGKKLIYAFHRFILGLNKFMIDKSGTELKV